MLGELKRLKYPGGKEELLYFLQSIIGNNAVALNDIFVLCTHAPAGYQLQCENLIAYCACFGWVLVDEEVALCPEVKSALSEGNLNHYLIESSLEMLFKNKVLTADMFTYDIDRCQVLFRNELLPLSFASIRNTLVSQEFLIAVREKCKTEFWVHSDFEGILAQLCKNSATAMTLEQLSARLEMNSIAGAKAERFVLEYEKCRIKNPCLQRAIKQISEVDVCAGYDILSYENDASTCHDRFIEVKAVARNLSFYWSKNEIEKAKLQGERYCLYLVDLSQIDNEGYQPVIISNPVMSVMDSPDWFVESESYHIQKIDL